MMSSSPSAEAHPCQCQCHSWPWLGLYSTAMPQDARITWDWKLRIILGRCGIRTGRYEPSILAKKNHRARKEFQSQAVPQSVVFAPTVKVFPRVLLYNTSTLTTTRLEVLNPRLCHRHIASAVEEPEVARPEMRPTTTNFYLLLAHCGRSR